MAAPQDWQVYDEFLATFGLKVVNLNTDTMKMALFLSTSNVGNAALVTAQYANATHELANGNGYTTGGVTLTGVSYSQTAGVATFTCDTASFSASGGNLVFRFAVMYDFTATLKNLICFSTLDDAPADVTIPDGQTLNVNIDPLGVFTLTQV
jgi:hypothetical protein